MKKLFTLFAVAAMAFAAQANVLTVCDHGGYDGYSNHVPVYGFWADSEGTVAQSIYPASMLTDMAGGKITEVQFYTLAQYYVENDMDPYYSTSNFIAFEGAKIQLALKEVTEDGFSTTTIVGATPVATTVPEVGDMYMTFQLDEPYAYQGGNLLVEAMVVEGGTFGTTYFYGVITGIPEYCSMYVYESSWSGTQKYFETFLPMVTFTYEAGTTPGPQVQADAPEIGVTYGVEGNHVAYVNINSNEENATIYYSYDGENWMVYEGELLFTENGTYTVYAYVTVPGKLDSAVNAVQFVVTPRTGMTDVMTGKTIASQRYFNIAGQEMQEANGLTIVVTTFTDGTTNTVKVVK